jgi:hypothetical protein
MIHKIINTLYWTPSYFFGKFENLMSRIKPEHIYFCICDHFEPYWNSANKNTARKRIRRWVDEYPKVADKNRDSNGLPLKYTFFYPEEEYDKNDLDELANLYYGGFGEVEVHLHHDNDTPENLRKTLLDYKKRLHEAHGLLSYDKKTGEIVYGFIHGNWALDNSRPDRRWCGVNNELTILQKTGCYADFTMPSAPDPTQTKKVNSIYYAVDDQKKPKSHNTGKDARVYSKRQGLLMVQGPISLNWRSRKWGIFPKIENGGLYENFPPNADRIAQWFDSCIHVKGAPAHIFIKIYTHGCQEKNMKMLFDDDGLLRLFEGLAEKSYCLGAKIHFVSAREMVNQILVLQFALDIFGEDAKNYFYKTISSDS